MKYLIVAAALIAAPLASANELDGPGTGVITQDQINKAADLPGTTIVRVSKTDPTDIQIATVKERLAPGQTTKKPIFHKVALAGERTGVSYTAANELDATSSTSSWAIGWRGPLGGGGFAAGGYGGYGGYRPYYGGYGGYGYRPYYANNYYYPNYGYGGYGYNNYGYANYHNCGGYNCHCGDYHTCNSYYPTYQYAGYNYAHTPYYGYSTPNYYYTYCGW